VDATRVTRASGRRQGPPAGPSNVVPLKREPKPATVEGVALVVDVDREGFTSLTPSAFEIAVAETCPGYLSGQDQDIGLEPKFCHDCGGVHGHGNVRRCREVQKERLADAVAARMAAPAPVATSADTYATKNLLADYHAERKGRKRAKDTLDFITKHSKTLLRSLPALAKDITHANLLGYVAARREEGAGEIVRKELHSVLRPALKLARKGELFDRDPLQVIPDLDSLAKPRERWLSPGEVLGIALYLVGQRMPHRAAAMAFAVAVGCDPSALPRACRKDVRDDYHGAQVHGTKRKTRERFAPTPMPEQRALLQWALQHAKPAKDGALFGTWANATRDLGAACDAIGVPRCCLNDLRRTYATWLGQAGIPDELIGQAMGHAPATTLAKHYRKRTADELMRMMEDEYAAHVAKPVAADTGTSAPTRGPRQGDEVRRDGIEPPTRGFSIPCSTD